MAMVGTGRRYRVLGTLGKGGFGTVYKAEMLGEGGFTKTVALKVLNPEVKHIEEVASRLRDEARVLGLIHHRAIVQVDALVRLDGRWAVVMECVDGVDLKFVVKSGGTPAGVAAEIVGEVASALHQAWVQPGSDGEPLRMLHRDIKPSNLQLTGNGEVKVLDFGTARANFAAREAQTRSLAFGTIDYMAPERLEFTDLPEGDIYALGVVFFELLTGETLGRTSAIPTRHEAFHDNADQRLRECGVPDIAHDLVMSMLSYDPDQRPDAKAVGQACRRIRQRDDGPWLADWAADLVPRLNQLSGGLKVDDYTGTILVEQPSGGMRREPDALDDPLASGLSEAIARTPEPPVPAAHPAPGPAPAPVPEPAPQERRGLLVPALVGGFLLALISGGAFLFVATGGMQDEAPAVVAPAPEAPAATAPEPPPAVPPEPPADATPEADAAPEADADPEADAAPAADAAPGAAPASEPAPAAKPKRGRVRVAGDADKVVLVSRSGRRTTAPASVHAGTYSIEATFEGRGTVQSGSVRVRAGGSHTVTCQRAFMRCDGG